jgi:hypothetical protein
MSDQPKQFRHPPDYPEPADDVIAGLAVRGRPVSRTQLARWHRAGYLPTPVQVPQGRGRGTVSFYPSGTRERVSLLCRFLTAERDLDAAGWRIWWDGQEISVRFARKVLEATAVRWERFVQDLRPTAEAGDGAVEAAEFTDDLSEQAWDVIDAAPKARIRRKLIRQARKRTGSEDFPAFFRVLLSVISGRFVGYSDTSQTPYREHQRTIVDTASGLLSRETAGLPEVAIVSEESEQGQVALSRALAASHPVAVLSAASDADCLWARDRAQGLLRWLEHLLAALAPWVEVGGPPLRAMQRSLSQFLEGLQDMSAEDQATLLLALLVARTWGRDTVAEILNPLPTEWRNAALAQLFQAPTDPDATAQQTPVRE